MSEEYSSIVEDNKEMLLTILEEIENRPKEDIKKDIVDCLEHYAKYQVPQLICQLDSDDPKACFDVVDLTKPVPSNYKKHTADLSKLDYSIPRDEEAKKKGFKEDMPISFLQIQEGNVEEGKNWYLNRFPRLPEPMAELMARYNWGDLKHQTKKKIKNDKKKATKRGKKYEPLAFKVEYGKFKINFD
tara:strand:+ start:596 stop:1156 length:561 start_codon:yes stop_codon:yes gene_type:complete